MAEYSERLVSPSSMHVLSVLALCQEGVSGLRDANIVSDKTSVSHM